MKLSFALVVVTLLNLYPLLAKAGQDFGNVVERLSDPAIPDFSGGVETKTDGSVWFRWAAAAGYSDQLEFGDGLETWFDAGSPV